MNGPEPDERGEALGALEFTREDAIRLLTQERNWGRWGPDDERGLLNLVTDSKRAAAIRLATSGRTISLSRKLPKTPVEGNQRAAHYYMRRSRRGVAGAAADYFGIDYHGVSATHIDALSHVWDGDGMWNGRSPDAMVTFNGITGGGIDNWRDGLITRGVLLDVPRFRGVPYVTQDAPVHGRELTAICADVGLSIEPGDAVLVRCGRGPYESEHGTYGTPAASASSGFGADERPGLHTSCLEFLRRSDCAALLWDMLDMFPRPFELNWSVHGAIFAFGLAIIDNADLEELAAACAEMGRAEFMVVVAPLRLEGGTGSPVNPLAIL